MFSFFNLGIIYLDNNSEKCLLVFNVIKGSLAIPSGQMTDNLLIYKGKVVIPTDLLCLRSKITDCAF